MTWAWRPWNASGGQTSRICMDRLIDKRKHTAVMGLPGTPAVGTDYAARLSEVIHGAHGLFLPIRTLYTYIY